MQNHLVNLAPPGPKGGWVSQFSRPDGQTYNLICHLLSCPILSVLFISAYIVCLLKKQTRHTVTAFAVVIVPLCLYKFIQLFFLIRLHFEFPEWVPSAVSSWNNEILWDSVNFW